ncbi:hypothetical protein HHX47_DHR9000527 [Lentinula edodes]|nr:hypothetical protein HHX47_DHR9000527 [Lentinula edodes]
MITGVFVGGTSGIGRAMAQAFARHTNGNAHIVIIGRNKIAAAELIASFPKADTNAIHEFIPCDVSLITNVHNTTSELARRLQRIDHLVLSSGILIFAGRNETSEGLDDKMALSYYSRWTFIHDLIPLMQKSERGAKVSGDIHFAALLESPPGFHSYNPKGKLMQYKPAEEETVEIVWEHTLELTERLHEH